MAKNERIRRGTVAEGFWDRPALMNLASDVLLLFAAGALIWAAFLGIKRLPFYPVREIVVVADVTHVTRAQIEHAARSAISGNLLGANLDRARGAFEKLPWVRRAELRRRWPQSLELVIEEHVAEARWSRPDNAGDDRLVNSHGELFSIAVAEPAMAALPTFDGPDGSSAAMLRNFREFGERLAGIQRKPVALALSDRAAWQVKLDDGVLIELGREQQKLPLAERLSRFVNHYAVARDKAGLVVAAVDMRYPNGFVLRGSRRATDARKS